MTVYLLTSGDGSDGSEWELISIHTTREKADRAKVDHDTFKRYRPDGTFYCFQSNEIEEWEAE